MSETLQNWAGNFTFRPARFHQPTTIPQTCEVIKSSSKLRILGTRHSFNPIADSPEDILSLEHLNRVLELDHARRRVTVEPGVRYGQLGQFLHREGYALQNLASLPHISVVGATATATHGSGEKNGNLSTAVAAMKIITAGGDLITLSRDQQPHNFDGLVVSLGALGAVVEITLNIVPTFDVRQHVFENLPFTELESHFDEIEASAYSVSIFTDWQCDRISQIWLKQLTNPPRPPAEPTFFGATPAPTHRHPITALSPINCTPQLGIPGPWHERLPHFRMDYTPSSGQELQSEYFVPRAHAINALRAVRKLAGKITPLLFITEIRTIAADTLWMSPCYHQDSVAIHFTWKQNWPAVREVLFEIESALAPFNARPHWGKLFVMEPSRLAELYQKMPEFQKLLRSYDPTGKFTNSFLDHCIFIAP